MSANRKNSKQAVALSLQDAYLDFMLSRKAKLVSEETCKLYEKTIGRFFIPWLLKQGITQPNEIKSRHVRSFISELAGRGLSDCYIHSYARMIKTMLRFFTMEKYIDEMILFDMPRIGQKKLPYLQADQLPKVLASCESKRDKALILFLVDTGLRRFELTAMNWGDVNFQSGLCTVRRGKGNKTREVIIGVRTRRALLAYKNEVNHSDNDPLFQTYAGNRITPMGLRSITMRLSKKTGIKFTPHALRRTFATLALKAGMSLVHIQGLMGHSSIEMTRAYIQTITDDYIQAHNEHGPIDSFLR